MNQEARPNEDRLVSLKQILGGYLPISKTTLFALLKSGQLQATKLGRRTFVRHSVLQAYINSLEAAR